MARKSTGTTRLIGTRWFGKFTRANKTRTEWLPLDPKIQPDDEAGAKLLAARMAVDIRARSANGGKGETVETVAQYAKRWCSWREKRGLRCVNSDRTRLERHILPVIGTLDVCAIGRDDLKKLVVELDDKAALGKSADGKPFTSKTASNVWSVVLALFRDAHKAKEPAMCVREDSPAKDVAGPEVGVTKAKVYLWPSEAAKLLASDMVPVRWRVLFAVAIYTYMRAGELAALEWGDVDLEHGSIHIHRSIDRVGKKGAKATKSDAARHIPIEANLLPLLRALKARATGRLVLSMPSAGVLSAKLKHYLRLAGADRAELFVKRSDPTRRAITFHDLRATGITWMAVRGDNPLRIKQRAGHSAFSTTEIYLREAENLAAGFGEVFPALPAEISIAPESPRALSQRKKRMIQSAYSGAEGNRTLSRSGPEAEQSRHVTPSAPQSELPQSRPVQAHPGNVPPAPGAPSVDLLRQKLDAAIVAEAWDAVKAVRERIVEAEREAALASGKVVELGARRTK